MQVSTYLKVSAGVAVVTIALKAWAWWITGSVSLLSDALEGFVNIAGAVFALGMVSWAAQPPDAGHPYGHHKAEYFSSGFEGVLILAAAIAILGASGERLLHPSTLASLGPGVLLSLAATVLNAALARSMFRKAREARSIALEGDARHLMADVWTSLGVVVGLAGVHFTHWLWLDPVVALCVAGNILREGVSLVWRSAEGLMDMAVEPEVRAQIDRTLAKFAHHAIRFDHVVTRRAGQRRFVDLHMHLPADWSLRRAAALRADVEDSLLADVPGLRATLQLLPMDVEAHVDETAEEAAQRAAPAPAGLSQAPAPVPTPAPASH